MLGMSFGSDFPHLFSNKVIVRAGLGQVERKIAPSKPQTNNRGFSEALIEHKELSICSSKYSKLDCDEPPTIG